MSTNIDIFIDNLTLSPSSIRTHENCSAGYIISKVLYPRIDTDESKKLTNSGRIFHNLAEVSFDKNLTDEMLAYETAKTKQLMNDFSLILKSRDYYDLPSIKEERLEMDIAELGRMVGIPDRVVDLGKKWILIIDYKTSQFCYPDKDLKQVLSYALLLWKVLDLNPDKMKVAIDYVKPNEVFQYIISKEHLIRHENYLISRFRAVIKDLKSFGSHCDVEKLTYTPGDCGICVLEGICKVYNLWFNAKCDPINLEQVSTIDLIREKLKRDEMKKIIESRQKAVNRTLMFRYENDQTEPGTGGSIICRDIIEEHMTKVQQSIESYNARSIIEAVVAKKAKKLVKGIAFGEMVDLQYLKKAMVDIILEHIPEKIGREAIPDKQRKKAEKFKIVGKRKPYLLLRN